jgi:hypothetical protein
MGRHIENVVARSPLIVTGMSAAWGDIKRILLKLAPIIIFNSGSRAVKLSPDAPNPCNHMMLVLAIWPAGESLLSN